MSDEWQDAGLTAYWAWRRLEDASSPLDEARAIIDLSEAMGDLVTWLPGYDYETGAIKENSDA